MKCIVIIFLIFSCFDIFCELVFLGDFGVGRQIHCFHCILQRFLLDF